MKAWIAGALLLAAPGAALAQDPWEEQVYVQLIAAAEEVWGDGFEIVYDPLVGSMGEGETFDWNVDLNTSNSYLIVGVCDSDCADLDLYVQDRTGEVVASDNTLDSIPVVSYAASATGNHVITANMYNCSVEPCRFGIAVFANSSGH